MTGSKIPPSIGARLTGPGRLATCRLGAVVVCKDDHAFGVSAKHVLDLDPEDRILDADSGLSIGTRVKLPQTEARQRPFYESLGAFRMEGSQFPGMGTADIQVNGLADSEAVLDKAVFKLDGNMGLSKGRVTSIGGAFRFINPYTREETIYRDLVTAAFDDNLEVPFDIGAAGSLVLDDRDAALGLLIGGNSKRCYIAPLDRFLAARSLSLAGSPAPWSSSSSLRAAGELRDTSRQLAFGRHRMLEELRAEPKVYADPDGRDVPARLLELLAESGR